MSMPPSRDPSELLRTLYDEVARAVDGGDLVRAALADAGASALGARLPTAVLAVGKVSFPMWQGVRALFGENEAALPRGLLVAPASRFPDGAHGLDLPPGMTALIADHPAPSDRSLAAGRAAMALLSSLGPGDRLLVLLSGGGSSLLALPAPGLSLEEKRDAVGAVARGGATITELNTVRKHLSALKGGRLALACPAPTTVLALSDVIGNDPGTIASGPFSPDPSTFAEAMALVERLAPAAPARVLEHLRQGASGALDETPKPGDTRLAKIDYRLIAGPDRVRGEARARALARGFKAGELARDTEAPVERLAAAYVERARREAEVATGGRVFVGNGEPSIVVTGQGRGGRATHLALLIARGIAGLPGVVFLAAGTDDRDGNGSHNGAVVDGSTWQKAIAAGHDPEAALADCNSEAPLAAAGALVRGPGTSNLLDLHLLAVGL